MTVEFYPNIFNDVLGPIMQPGSSSHTAGPCRLGYLANCLLGERPRTIRIILDPNGSFAGTFGIMHEDSGMLAGALGMFPDDERLCDVHRIAREQGIDYAFEFTPIKESAHLNAVKFLLTGESGKTASLVGDSTGGGMVQTKEVNGYPLQIKGDTYVVLVTEKAGSSATNRLRDALSGIVDSGVVRVDTGGVLHFIKTSVQPEIENLRALLPEDRIEMLKPVLPVITRANRKPQLFTTMTRWRQIAAEQHIPLWEGALNYEMDASGWSREQTIDFMRKVERVMYRQTHAVFEESVIIPESPFKPNRAALWKDHMQSSRCLTDEVTANTLRLAYGAGSGIPGVKTVPGPMGRGGGYIHAALWAIKEKMGLGDEDLLKGLFVAGGVGVIAYTRTAPTCEIIGCTGECGICGAMAAAAITEMVGGSPGQVENAASLSLQAAIGLPCDPIPGGMGQPCRSRIIAATCMAHVFADIALSGQQAVLPLHEVIDTADAVGRQLPPELRCTSKGGLCRTPTALRQSEAYLSWFEACRSEGRTRPPGNLI